MTAKKGRITSRTRARRRASDVLFEADQKGFAENPTKLLRLLERRLEVTPAPSELPAYAAQIVEGVANDLPAINRLLEEHATGIQFDRLPAVDRALMRVAVWELLNNSEDVPPIVAIDEAVALAAELSTPDSPSYVNAILDAVRASVEVQADELVAAAADEVAAAETDEWDEELLEEY